MQLPNIGNLFRPTQQVTPVSGNPAQMQPPAQAPIQPQSGPAVPGALPAPGSTMQVQNPDAGNPNPPITNNPAADSPLDAWKDVWHTDPKATPPVDPWSQPILPSDPVRIREAASKMDMMAGMPPELIQKVTAGNDPAALMDLMNRVAQSTLAMAAQLSTASVERAGTVIRDRTQQELPNKLRDYQLDNLPIDNPVLNHPGAQGMLQMARQQLKMKNPNWSAQQVQAEAERYLTSFAGALSQHGSATSPSNKSAQEQDWDSFLN